MTCDDLTLTCDDMWWHVMTCDDMWWHVMTCDDLTLTWVPLSFPQGLGYAGGTSASAPPGAPAPCWPPPAPGPGPGWHSAGRGSRSVMTGVCNVTIVEEDDANINLFVFVWDCCRRFIFTALMVGNTGLVCLDFSTPDLKRAAIFSAIKAPSWSH